MASANSAQTSTPGKKVLNPILDLPTEASAPSTLLWDELVEEARVLDALVAELKKTEINSPNREQLEQKLLSSLAHVRVHSQVLEDSLTEALLKADELEATHA